MRHRNAGVKLGRTGSHRKAMFRNMVTSLFKYDRIRTTDTKAKALRGWADHLITLAKRGDLHARRQALAIVREKNVVHKLFAEAADRYGNVSGGYTRIVKLGRRPGDCAPVSLIELIAREKSTSLKRPSVTKDTVSAEKQKSAAAEDKSAETEEPKKEESVQKAGASSDQQEKSEGGKTEEQSLGGISAES
ncbi:MAG: 50S ribosomal protein L17 [Desulfococcaceae bacterium]